MIEKREDITYDAELEADIEADIRTWISLHLAEWKKNIRARDLLLDRIKQVEAKLE
jgi:hypothetical protein